MSDWEIKYEQPHGVDNGPYYVGTFHVGRAGSMLRPVLVKLTFSAAELFAAEFEQLTGRRADAIVRGHVIASWGDEKIREWLASSRELPEDLSIVTRPSSGNSYMITPVDAQLMLKRWGLADQEKEGPTDGDNSA